MEMADTFPRFGVYASTIPNEVHNEFPDLHSFYNTLSCGPLLSQHDIYEIGHWELGPLLKMNKERSRSCSFRCADPSSLGKTLPQCPGS